MFSSAYGSSAYGCYVLDGLGLGLLIHLSINMHEFQVTAVLLTHAFLDDKDGWLIFAKDYPSYGIPFSL